MWSADVIGRLGVLVRGLTTDDINSFPLDTELLSIVEILSDYENRLDGGQVWLPCFGRFTLVSAIICYSW